MVYKSVSRLNAVMSIDAKGSAVNVTNRARTTVRTPKDTFFMTGAPASMSGHLRPAGHAQDEHGAGQQDGEQEQGDGSAHAQVAADDAFKVGHAGEDVGRIEGSAPGENV